MQKRHNRGAARPPVTSYEETAHMIAARIPVDERAKWFCALSWIARLPEVA